MIHLFRDVILYFFFSPFVDSTIDIIRPTSCLVTLEIYKVHGGMWRVRIRKYNLGKLIKTRLRDIRFHCNSKGQVDS